ncbi:hypothetical protein TNCV_1601661 [Trichonephila clavipes]|nr:hypothetical protein TNCV_1601661 [Trichonephila clavipes]
MIRSLLDVGIHAESNSTPVREISGRITQSYYKHAWQCTTGVDSLHNSLRDFSSLALSHISMVFAVPGVPVDLFINDDLYRQDSTIPANIIEYQHSSNQNV